MLTDFAKLKTFLTVVKEKSFSKASYKLGISQPAVTQQMKFIEDYLDVKILYRKKNGIQLTDEGKKLFSIAQKINKCICSSEKDLLKIMNKELTFVIGASFTIGSHILPKLLDTLEKNINNKVSVDISSSSNIIDNLLDNKIDLAIVESYIANDSFIYREWIEDEIVIFSNQKLPLKTKAEDLLTYKWVCLNPNSKKSILLEDALKKANLPSCNKFHIDNKVIQDTDIVETVVNSDTKNEPTVSIASRYSIDSLLKNKILFETTLGRSKIMRKLYIVYKKDRKHDAFIENVVNYLLTRNK